MRPKRRTFEQRNHSRGRLGDAAVSDDVGDVEAAPAGLRQADDLLPADDADAGGHHRVSDHHYARGSGQFQKLLGSGSQWGVKIHYAAQPHPGGLAQAFLIGRDFVAGEPSCLILCDNIFYGLSLPDSLRRAAAGESGATVFAYRVPDPERYGVAEFDDRGRAISIEEKPEKPRSNFAVTGLYFYAERVCDFGANLKPSPRGELEITDLNRVYLSIGELRVEQLGRGFAWFDTGTQESLLQAANFGETGELRQGLKIACPEEVAHYLGLIDDAQLRDLATQLQRSTYGKYLLNLLDEQAQRASRATTAP